MATITPCEAKNVFNLPKEKGKEALARLLDWEIDEDLQMQRAIHLDFLHDTLIFASEKGFAWEKVATVFCFGDRLVQQFKGCNSINDIVDFYKSQSSYLVQCLGERDYKTLTGFVFETILPHFKLYQYVFNIARSEQNPNVPVKVHIPFDSMVLKDTKTLKVWNYEKQIEELEQKERDMVVEKHRAQEKKMAQIETESKTNADKATQIETLNKEAVMNIMEEVMKGYRLAATEKMKYDIEKLQDDLEFKFEKTVLPRPQVLGAPPRYTVQELSQNPLKAVKSANKKPKSPKSESPTKAKSPKPGSRESKRSQKK